MSVGLECNLVGWTITDKKRGVRGIIRAVYPTERYLWCVCSDETTGQLRALELSSQSEQIFLDQ